MPTNADFWDSIPDQGEQTPTNELARTHPGDVAEHDAVVSEESTAHGHPRSHQPVTTKAGSRLWSISFVAPDQAGMGTLRAAYPMQLLVRHDPGRQQLIYDAFEHKPVLKAEFDEAWEQFEAGGEPPVTEAEMKDVERILKTTKQQARAMLQMMGGGGPGALPGAARGLSPPHRRMHYGRQVLFILSAHVHFKNSLLRRVRFPLSAVCGARVITVDYQRPNRDLAPARGNCSLSQLGQPSDRALRQYAMDDEPVPSPEDGGPRVAVGSQLCGDALEPMGVLILELASDAELSFAATRLCPAKRRDQCRVVDADWTPQAMASKARRHYIVGDASEIAELSNYLAKESSVMKKLLVAPETNDDAVVELQRQGLNTLAGLSAEALKPQGTTKVPSLLSLAAAQLGASSGDAPPPPPTEALPPARFPDCDSVHQYLQSMGVTKPEHVNPCLKQALLRGFVKAPATKKDFMKIVLRKGLAVAVARRRWSAPSKTP